MATRTAVLEIAEDYLLTAKKLRRFGDFLESSHPMMASTNRVLANQIQSYGINLLLLYVRINTLAGQLADEVNRSAGKLEEEGV
ncbi:hypothetical protein [Amycolatopsis saalfeldensis]|uniref:Uncharacterized protein n=1 Tax=Amycolatopsis saalfeldensis TaxID=394193 RepID=A0A1H8YJW7_9PSEU|nr:hypothetical protein [Amycolatopsis saalfeldensis]SEP52446.1 hypothetical protein SAMN04489732_120109 [Amycolatopsis saalfeldensis]